MISQVPEMFYDFVLTKPELLLNYAPLIEIRFVVVFVVVVIIIG